MAELPCDSRLPSEQTDGLDGKWRLVVLPIDPYRVHVYWTFEPAGRQNVNPTAGAESTAPVSVLRFHSVPNVPGDQEESGESFDAQVELAAPNWYVHLPKPSGRYVVELGLRTEDGRFSMLARSGPVQTPPISVSENHAETLMLVLGDLALPNPFPRHTEERLARTPSPPHPVTVSEPGAPSALNADSPAPFLPLFPPETPPLIQSAGGSDGAAHTGAGSTPGDPEAATVDGLQLEERHEGSFTGGLSSIQLGAGRHTR